MPKSAQSQFMPHLPHKYLLDPRTSSTFSFFFTAIQDWKVPGLPNNHSSHEMTFVLSQTPDSFPIPAILLTVLPPKVEYGLNDTV